MYWTYSPIFARCFSHLKVQGMSFIAAVLILNLEEADAFIAFANLLNKPCQLAFFRVDHSMVRTEFSGFGPQCSFDLKHSCFIDDFLLSRWIMENFNLWLQNWECQVLIHKTHSHVLIFPLETFNHFTCPKESHCAVLTSSVLGGVCVGLRPNILLMTAYDVPYYPYRCWNILQPLKYFLKKIFLNCFFISNHTVLLQTYIW